MWKKTIIISIVLVIVFVVNILFFPLGENKITAKAEEVEKETMNWIENIPDVELELSINSAFPSVLSHPDEFFEIYKVGYAAAPVLIEYVIEKDMNDAYGAFMVAAAANNLHLNGLPGAIKPNDENPVYAKDEDAYTPVWYAKQLQLFARETPEKVEKICNSNISMSDKIEKLQEYGMLAVPFLQEKVGSGDMRWKECLSILTLSGITVEERFDILAYGFRDEVLYSEIRDKLIYQKKSKIMETKNFDEQWFDNNSDELMLMSELFQK